MIRKVKTRFDLAKGYDSPFDTPIYSLSAAAHYLRVPEATLRYWIGGSVRGRKVTPILRIPDPDSLILSFHNLAEAYVIRLFKQQYRLKLPAIRAAVEYVALRYECEHPLLTHDFLTDGGSLLIEEAALSGSEELLDASAQGQRVMRGVVEAYLERLERTEKGGLRLYPLTRKHNEAESPRTVLIDPRHSFGQPVLSDCYIPTAIIAERHRAGESIADLAVDYECEGAQIEEALRYEARTAA